MKPIRKKHKATNTSREKGNQEINEIENLKGAYENDNESTFTHNMKQAKKDFYRKTKKI